MPACNEFLYCVLLYFEFYFYILICIRILVLSTGVYDYDLILQLQMNLVLQLKDQIKIQYLGMEFIQFIHLQQNQYYVKIF
jgi:hypothetical protein